MKTEQAKHSIMDKAHLPPDEQKKPDTKEDLPQEYINMKFKSRQNKGYCSESQRCLALGRWINEWQRTQVRFLEWR